MATILEQFFTILFPIKILYKYFKNFDSPKIISEPAGHKTYFFEYIMQIRKAYILSKCQKLVKCTTSTFLTNFINLINFGIGKGYLPICL